MTSSAGLPAYRLVTAEDYEAFLSLSSSVETASGPEFLNSDPAVERFWPELPTAFPAYQFCLIDQETGKPIGIGNSIPIRFTGEWSALPAGGLDWVLEQGFHGHAEGEPPTLVSALYILVSDSYRGSNMSVELLANMKRIARRQGFDHLIAPVRPWMKSRYPLIPMEEYCQWQNGRGEPFDPWLRVHIRAGGRMLHICERAMAVDASTEAWSAWTGMEFPGDGSYTIPHGLVPLEVRSLNGKYVEPGVWVLHELT